MAKLPMTSSDDDENVTARFSRAELEQATRVLGTLLSRLRAPETTGQREDESGLASARLKERARAMYVARRARMRFFARGINGEPAWDMLLALYGSDVGPAGHTTTEVTEMSAAPPTTALRWLDYLVDQGLVTKEISACDRRVVCVRLSAKARKAMEDYFSWEAKEALGDSFELC
jgi:hypothetical protein